jgi:general secretion pathway protein D
MKRFMKRNLPLFVLILFVVSFLSPGTLWGARVTGKDETVTTSKSDAVKQKKKTAMSQEAKKTVAAKPAGVVKRPKATENAGETANESKYISIDFDNVDIRVFIKFMSEITGKNFVVDKGVKGTVTVISPKKILVDEAYRVFESVLEVHGFTSVPAGDIIKIVPSRAAKEKNVETRLKEEAWSPEDRVITQIVSLDYANPDEMKKVLTPLVSKSSVILSYSPTGMLVVTDLMSNIQRLLRIIKALDIEGIEEQISVIPLQHAAATEIAKSLNLIFQKTPSRKGALVSLIKIVPDERTNTIIALASENDAYRIRELIRMLDKEVPRGEEKIRVYRLQNADAEELTKVLMNLPTDKNVKTDQKGKQPLLSKEINIVPDKATNTLIITADRDDYRVIEEVIKQLDIPRPMVYIEALIMEVNVDKAFNLGVEWVGAEFLSHTEGREKIYGGGFGGAGGKYPGLSNIPSALNPTGTLPTGFSLGVFGSTIDIGGVTFPNLGAILQTYREDQDVHIISTPQILTLDNEEAEIYVGENVPYLSKSATGDQNYETYEYKDVGVTLRLTPQISQERFVRLNIFQEVTKLIPQTEGDFRPSTLKRTAKTAVTIKDTNTIVIGGLIGDDITNNEFKVPLLGDIPVLGWLFKYRGESREKRNLFIFITPHIVENPVEAKALYEEKEEHLNEMEEGVIKTHRKQRDKK